MAMAYFSFLTTVPVGGRIASFTLAHYVSFFTKPIYWFNAWRSIELGIYVTAISLLVGYPAALALSRYVRGRWREAIFLLIILPFWSNALVRTFSWTMVLREPLNLLFTYPAIVIGLVHAYLPYAILTIYISLQAIDESLIEASRSLGATAIQTFFRVILPLSMPGVLAAIFLIFVPVIGSFMEPRILGGRMRSCWPDHRGSVHRRLQLAARRGAFLHDAGDRAADAGDRRSLLKRQLGATDAASVPCLSRPGPGLPLPADPGDGGDGVQPLGALRASPPSTSSGSGHRRQSAAPRGELQQRLDRRLQCRDRHLSRHPRGHRLRPLQLPRQAVDAVAAVPADHHSLADHRHLHADLLLLDRDRPRPPCHLARSCRAVAALCHRGGRRQAPELRTDPRGGRRHSWRDAGPDLPAGNPADDPPGVVTAALFAFAVSFDQFVISYFLAPPGTSTLPVEIYTAIRKGFTPEINAVSSIIIVISMGLMLAVARNYRFGGD